MAVAAKRGVVLALIMSGALAFPALAEDKAAGAPNANTVVATVNGADVTLGQMAAARAALPAEYQSLPDDVLFNGILEQLIQQTALASVGEQSKSPRDAFFLKNDTLSYYAGAVLDATAKAATTPEAVQAAYDAKYAQAEAGKEYHAAHILVPTEEEAKALKAKLDAGANFDELAKENSTGPSGGNAGDLGWFSAGMMVKPFEDAVMGMKVGEISGPVKTDFGWHVIQLKEVRDALPPKLDDVRDELTSDLQQKAVEAKVRELTAVAKIEKKTDGVAPALIKDQSILGR